VNIEENDLSPVFKLILHKTYYQSGFFNITVDFNRYIGNHQEIIKLQLGNSGKVLKGRIDRRANKNGTPRIHGGSDLRNWFQSIYNIGDTIEIYILSPVSLKIGNKS